MKTKTVKVNDSDWQVTIVGNSGPVVLLVHGFPLDHRMWEHQLDGLKDVTLIAPDLPGFGGSEMGKVPFSIESLADDLAALLDGLGVDQPIVYCGLSMGGYIGWQFWRRHPNRLAAMIGCDTRAAADPIEVARAREMMAARVRSEGSEFVVPAMIPKLFAAQAVEANTVAVKSTTKVIVSTDPESIARGQMAMAARVDATEWLPKIDIPTLWVVGTEDVITTVDEMRGIAEAIPNARLLEIANAGHMAPLEQPDPVNQGIREFLAL